MLWNLKTLAVFATLTTTLVAGTAWYSYSSGRQSGMSAIQSKWDAERAATLAAQAEQQMKARQQEQALKALMAQQRKAHQNEVARIVREYAALTDSLQDRADRPSGGSVPQDSNVGVVPADGCTGAQLFRPDAEFLAGETALAAGLQSALKSCLAAYNQARREVNGE